VKLTQGTGRGTCLWNNNFNDDWIFNKTRFF